MEQEEGLLFLLRRAKLLAPDAKDLQMRQFAEVHPGASQAATALVAALGGLPLALDQAGAYQALGENHPHTIATQALYTELMQQEDQMEQAARQQ